MIRILTAIVLAMTNLALAQLQPADLRCEFGTDPMGIDVVHPRLSWRVTSDQRGQRQTAYQLLVATSVDALKQDKGDLWDSGKVQTDQTTFVQYGGAAPKSSQQVFWKVRVWDRDGNASAWSTPATWTMGLFEPAEWKGQWISPPSAADSTILRREFTVRPGLKRAVVHVCGLGQFEMNLNGAKVGQDLLTPGWTDYRDTALYETYDVTSMLRDGPNAAGLILGNGMYHVVRPQGRFAKFTGSFGALRAIAHLRLEYADGSTELVGTDENWRSNPGPITFNSIYGGEDFDARLLPPGWDKPGFDDSGWSKAIKAEQKIGALRGHSVAAEPIRVIEVRKPVNVKDFPDGTTVYDFGQNASFMPRLRISGPVGSTVKLTPSEVLNADGSIQRSTMGGASRGSSWWSYTKSTDGEEAYFPRFYYLGSRYLKAERFPTTQGATPPKIESIESDIVHSIARPVGQFRCSSDMLNRIRDLVRWAQRSNMVSLLTDCPHREKLGWVEQFHLNGPAFRYEFDLARLSTKSTNDMRDSQLENGLVPNIAPEYTEFRGTFRAAAEWAAAFILVPWQQYEFNGDTELLRKHYDAMKRYYAYLESKTKDGILSEGLGDWYDIGPTKSGPAQNTPPPVTATAFLYYDAKMISQIAVVLGKVADGPIYEAKAEQVRQRYNREFYHADKGSYATGSQCSNAMALVMDIVEPENRAKVFDALVKDIEQRDYANTAGDVGYRYVLLALMQGGRSDIIFRMINRDDKPGYGWMLKQGETALTEAWNANLTSSHNHFMLGQITEWFYKGLVGIDCDPAVPGFKSILIRPNPVGDLTWAEATYESIHGPIVVRWDRSESAFKLKATIPANTTATVFLPATEGTSVLESGKPVEQAGGVKFLRREGDRAVYAIESGSYTFEAR
jgi:hypothetical protein